MPPLNESARGSSQVPKGTKRKTKKRGARTRHRRNEACREKDRIRNRSGKARRRPCVEEERLYLVEQMRGTRRSSPEKVSNSPPPFSSSVSSHLGFARVERERERNRCCREVSRACEEVIKWTGAVRKTTAQFNRARAHLRASAAETITRTRYNLRSGDYINGRRRSGARAQGAQNAPRACLPIACAILPAQSARERQAAWLRERLWLWL